MPSPHDAIKCKGIHIKLDREAHARFKIRLVTHGVAMQEAIEEFVRLVGNGDLRANGIIDRLVSDKVKAELEAVGLKSNRKHRRGQLNELDNDALYGLINEGDESPTRPRGGGHNEAA